tara:strand:+ start:12322 stop:12603 length:282 start_codon:yes stop_codon:yes gene_type:complete
MERRKTPKPTPYEIMGPRPPTRLEIVSRFALAAWMVVSFATLGVSYLAVAYLYVSASILRGDWYIAATFLFLSAPAVVMVVAWGIKSLGRLTR